MTRPPLWQSASPAQTQEGMAATVRPPRWWGHPATQSGPVPAPPTALSKGAVQLRCLMWLIGVCFIDMSGRPLMGFLLTGCLLDLWLMGRTAPVGQGLALAVHHVLSRLRALPAQVWLFAAIMTLNVALEYFLVEPVARPFFFNIMALHAIILVWACITTPASRAARAALHRGATLLICVFGAILLLQLVLQFGVGYTLDLREILTGEPSRSGIDEDSPGERPTTFFSEPSNLAIMAFTLTLIARLTGPQTGWLTAVAGLTCLLNNSGIGLFLALYLLAEEALLRLKKHVVLVPLIVATILALAWIGVALNLEEFKLGALERIIHPQNRYDPVGVRLYIPLRIAAFDTLQHLIGTGIANYAAFKDGYTQYDSSFLLGVYFQAGLLGMPLMLLTLVSAWRVHSWRAALMVAVLYSTKMGLMTTAFWALVLLLHHRTAVCPAAHSQRHHQHGASSWRSFWTSWLPRTNDASDPAPGSTAAAQRHASAVGQAMPLQPTDSDFDTTHARPLSPALFHARRPHHSRTERRRR
jgi:hypothetical protein